ncbi:hypothetical protein BT96DRAFT_517210 [Gymnopus androsaceus JB14]|uniref:DUF6534 domain-containing protein n=1 Tax=Gymnopus androsaceus JB14 TaxID=1447944 RepID=A0A6A4HYY7_9AGAR|nr:hypothetical protein BT96DRAFT_517210 [Gymnopus androsaceus JB14]
MPVVVHFNNTYGALFISNILTAILWGATCVQLYFYSTTYWNKDTWMIKSLVFAVCLLDTLHQAFSTLSNYEYLVTHWGDFDYIETLNWSFKAEVFPLYFTQFFVQSFMVYRIYRFKKNIWLPAILELTVVAYFGNALSYGIRLVKFSQLADLGSLNNQAISCVAVNTFNDVAIALVFAYVLQQQKTGFQNTTTIINRIVIYSLNTGICTAMFGIAAIIATLAAGKSDLQELFFLTGARLYANSLLAILNLRNRSRLVNNKNEFTSLGHISNRTTSAGEIHDLGSQTDQIETPDQIALKSIVSLQNVPQRKNAFGIPTPLKIKLNKHTTSVTDYKTPFPSNTNGGYAQSEQKVLDSV